MKNILIISFDLVREGEVKTSLAIASLLAYVKNDKRYGNDFIVDHLSFNMVELKNTITNEYIEQYLSTFQLENFDTIGISSYIWNEYLLKPLIKNLRGLGFVGKIVLGGYQITYSTKEKLRYKYPEADIFILGYAEKSFLQSILIDKPTKPIYLDSLVDFSKIPSVYISNEIQISQDQRMIRLETKRGCPYRCSFCAHRDLRKNKLYKHEISKIFEELSFLKSKNIKRINVLDPVFNIGNDYLNILQEVERINFYGHITLQTRFEMIKGKKGKKFLDLLERINAHLEFGLQTVIEDEYKVINRSNDIKMIRSILHQLKRRNISYEVSLIYGLPNQTIDSFKYSIDFLLSNGCNNIIAYPLMLLKGTELYEQKEKYHFLEKTLGDFNIPTVIASNSFSKNDWLKMDKIAETLDPNVRL